MMALILATAALSFSPLTFSEVSPRIEACQSLGDVVPRSRHHKIQTVAEGGGWHRAHSQANILVLQQLRAPLGCQPCPGISLS